MNSIFSGLSGMQANQKAVDVIANNVANLNTVAYKSGRLTFQETLVRTFSRATIVDRTLQIGTGVTVGSINTMMEQGITKPTGRPLDMAIVGDGFFVVTDGPTPSHTRDGVFQLDDDNRLVLGSNGMKLMGWKADLFTGAIDTNQSPSADLQIPIGSLYAVPTTNVTYGGNLNAASAGFATKTATVNVFDSLGTQHAVTVNFTKVAPGQWDWTASCPDAGFPGFIGMGMISFDDHGRVTSGSATANLILGTANGSTQPLTFALDFSAVSQLDGADTIQAASQDGLPMGTLQNYSIDDTGIIYGSFSNGASRRLGQVALARFTNPAGLMREGGNLWNVSPNSGDPVVSPPSNGGGKVRSGYLEQSNVDLTSEFANLIVTQRSFQANSRSITTSDEMLQEIMQLKR